MRHRFLVPLSALAAALAGAVALLSLAVSMPGQSPATPAKAAPSKSTGTSKAATPPRTPWGDPDLQGTWFVMFDVPLERSAANAGKEFLTDEQVAAADAAKGVNPGRNARSADKTQDVSGAYNAVFNSILKTGKRTSMIIDPPDGRIPAFTPEARKREDARAEERLRRAGPDPADSWEDRSLGERCITRGVPKLPGAYNNNVQIVQSPRYVTILQEMIHEVRTIPLDGRPHIDKSIRQWVGDPRGRWEGNTLVVDTTNYTYKPVFNAFNCCRGASGNLHLVERFRRIDADTIDYQYTVDDPTTYTRPWTVSVPMTRSEGPIYEYACHEGNYGMLGILSGHRADEKAAAEAAKR